MYFKTIFPNKGYHASPNDCFVFGSLRDAGLAFDAASRRARAGGGRVVAWWGPSGGAVRDVYAVDEVGAGIGCWDGVEA